MKLLSKSLKPNAFPFECVLTKPLNIPYTFLSVRKDCINQHNPLDSFICVFHKFHICLVCMHKVPCKWKQILDITTKVWIPVMTNLRTGLVPQWPSPRQYHLAKSSLILTQSNRLSQSKKASEIIALSGGKKYNCFLKLLNQNLITEN